MLWATSWQRPTNTIEQSCSNPPELLPSLECAKTPSARPLKHRQQSKQAHKLTYPISPPPLALSQITPLQPQSPGLKRPQTATIPSPHSLAAILSPSAPPEDPIPGGSRSSTPKRTHAEAFSNNSDQSYLHLASPTQHRASIASTEEPSPGTRGADDGSGGAMIGGQEEKKPPQKMVRSSIACARCRRSKVKCKLQAHFRHSSWLRATR